MLPSQKKTFDAKKKNQLQRSMCILSVSTYFLNFSQREKFLLQGWKCSPKLGLTNF